ncbi:TlpA family protein disulfide reductase [Sinosporangium siamense]|uniref:Thioredoxin domain-containing protein n=1 Tax=Sinosporangium siamense TaxID=1367973 RepID=A0A919V7D2_9ACTN|nr:hypothetical protein [Sinosporangium siamense]GII91967.1 hypothetical protein Ssi02_21980 [Sinosporangium siamense]
MSVAIVVIVAVCLAVTLLNLILTAVLFRQLGVFVLGTSRGANDSGISVGRRLPRLDLVDARSNASVDVHTREPKLLFFGSTACSECSLIYPDIKYVEDHYDIQVVNLLFGKDIADVTAYAQRFGVKGPVVFANEEIGQAYDVEVSPFAFVVDHRGLVAAKGLMNTRTQLIKMLAPVRSVEFAEEHKDEIHVIA